MVSLARGLHVEEAPRLGTSKEHASSWRRVAGFRRDGAGERMVGLGLLGRALLFVCGGLQAAGNSNDSAGQCYLNLRTCTMPHQSEASLAPVEQARRAWMAAYLGHAGSISAGVGSLALFLSVCSNISYFVYIGRIELIQFMTLSDHISYAITVAFPCLFFITVVWFAIIQWMVLDKIWTTGERIVLSVARRRIAPPRPSQVIPLQLAIILTVVLVILGTIFGGIAIAEWNHAYSSHSITLKQYGDYERKDVAIIRALDKGLLLWDGSRVFFVTWPEVVSIREKDYRGGLGGILLRRSNQSP